MTRINVVEVDEETGEETLTGWFDDDSATIYPEETRWDNDAKVSLSTGTRWTHECLYLTAGGRWVRKWWSQWIGVREKLAFITTNEAREWLIRNEYSTDVIEGATGAPMPPEMGRPAIGPQVKIRMPEDIIGRVDLLAEQVGLTRSAWIRQVIEAALI